MAGVGTEDTAQNTIDPLHEVTPRSVSANKDQSYTKIMWDGHEVVDCSVK